MEDVGNGKWAFKADNGLYLSICLYCVGDGSYPYFAFIFADNPGLSYVQWTVKYKLRYGRSFLQADTRGYLSRCNDCGIGNYPDSVSLEENGGYSWTIWEISSQGNQVAFKSDSGKFLAVCHECW